MADARGFTPVADERVMGMDFREAKDYLDEIKAVLEQIKMEKRDFLAGHTSNLHSKLVSRTMVRLNAERQRYIKFYEVAQARLTQLKYQRKGDADRSADNWLHLFYREAERSIGSETFRAIVDRVSMILPMPSRLKGRKHG